jgi:hypothetical protein
MGRFGLIGPSYRSQSLLADCQTTMNWYPEAIESGLGRSAMALYPTPGLNLLYQIGAAGMRGEITLQGRTFAVQGTSFVELLPPNAVPNVKNWSTTLGVPILSDGNPVSMAGGGYQVLFTSAGNAYVFNLQANTLTLVVISPNVPTGQVAFADSFFFALVQNPNSPWQINSSNSYDATTWQGTNFTEVEVFSDNPNSIFEAFRLLWVFGPKGIQPYSNTGDFPFPFDVIPGTYIENGLGAPFAVAKFDNSIGWLGADERGNGMVWRMNGFTPQRISNHAVEYALQSYSTIADCVMFPYQDQGHSFLQLGFPTADKTWVYDAATQLWHERGFWNTKAGKFNRHRAGFHTFNYGMHLVGDPTIGNVYQMAINIYSDFGNPIRRVRRSPHVNKELKRITHNRVQVDAEVGIGPNLQGNQPATTFTLQDLNGNPWTVGISDTGILTVAAGSNDIPQNFFLNDPVSNTAWQITVVPIDATHAALAPIAAPANLGYPGAYQMTSVSGNLLWALSVKQVAAGIAQMVITPQGSVGRGPLWTLKWSDDGAQTFSQGQSRDGGMTGNYRQRLLWNRLGSPLLDRVYELSTSEVFPARVIDAYLEAGADYQPSQRLTQQIAKQA